MNTIGDLDDVTLAKAIRALLRHVEPHGGQITIGREMINQYGLSMTTGYQQPHPGDWSISVHFASEQPGRTKSASLSHADPLEMLIRIDAALR